MVRASPFLPLEVFRTCYTKGKSFVRTRVRLACGPPVDLAGSENPRDQGLSDGRSGSTIAVDQKPAEDEVVFSPLQRRRTRRIALWW